MRSQNQPTETLPALLRKQQPDSQFLSSARTGAGSTVSSPMQ